MLRAGHPLAQVVSGSCVGLILQTGLLLLLCHGLNEG